jgi:hypothetical protein
MSILFFVNNQAPHSCETKIMPQYMNQTKLVKYSGELFATNKDHAAPKRFVPAHSCERQGEP